MPLFSAALSKGKALAASAADAGNKAVEQCGKALESDEGQKALKMVGAGVDAVGGAAESALRKGEEALASETGQKGLAVAKSLAGSAKGAADAASGAVKRTGLQAWNSEYGCRAREAGGFAAGQIVERARAKGITYEELCRQFESKAEKVLTSTGEEGWVDRELSDLIDTSLELGLLGPNAPERLKRASRWLAKGMLKRALESDHPKHVKGVMVAAGRLNATDSQEFSECATRYKSMKTMPEHWDMEAMVKQRKGGLLVAIEGVANERVIDIFQHLFDRTFRSVYTRDRRGDPVPTRMVVESVQEVANDQVWEEYLILRELVRQELEERRVADNVLGLWQPGGLHWPPETSGMLLPEQERELLQDAPLMKEVNETLLFHGTNPVAAKAIATTDFRVNLAGSNAGTLYGRGIYLAENSTKSDEYTVPDDDDLRTILVCRAVLGSIMYLDTVEGNPRGCEEACLDGPHHSVLGDRRKARGTFREFVVFDDDLVYPAFVISYRREVAPNSEASEAEKAFRKEIPLVTEDVSEEGRRDIVQGVFKKFDLNSDGFISRSELKTVLSDLGAMCDEEINTLFHELDENGDSKIDTQEFLNFVFGGAPPGSRSKDVGKVVTAPTAADASGDEVETLWQKTIGDYHGYRAERLPAESEERTTAVEFAREAYKVALDSAEKLAAAHPLRLGVGLASGSFEFYVLRDASAAVTTGRRVFDAAVKAMASGDVDRDIQADAVKIIGQLNAALQRWKLVLDTDASAETSEALLPAPASPVLVTTIPKEVGKGATLPVQSPLGLLFAMVPPDAVVGSILPLLILQTPLGPMAVAAPVDAAGGSILQVPTPGETLEIQLPGGPEPPGQTLLRVPLPPGVESGAVLQLETSAGLLSVTVPEGAKAGAILQVLAFKRDGWSMAVAVPPGAPPGATFQVATPDGYVSATVPPALDETVDWQEEAGSWTYVVVAEGGVDIRDRPLLSAKTSRGPSKDERVKICTRMKDPSGTTFLRLTNGKGWLVDKNSRGEELTKRDDEDVDEGVATEEKGNWTYTVLASNGIGLRDGPAHCAKAKHGPLKGERVRISTRVKVGPATFLGVDDQPGWWLFDVNELGKEVMALEE